jgi:photosystem II stability/assembly factor-like uncharacterized protein
MTIVCLSPNGVDTYRTDAAPDTVLVATLDGVVRLSRETDGEWSATDSGLSGLHVSSLMREPVRGTLFAGIHGSGLYRSSDDGRTWASALRGIQHPHVFTLACVERGGTAELYAGTEPAHLYRSRDFGDIWEELAGLRDLPSRAKWNFPAPPHIAHVKHVAFDPRNSAVMYVCIEQGALLKSSDGGQSFQELEFQDATYKLNKDTHRIVPNPTNPDEIYVDGGDGIARSRDAGKSWERVATPAIRVAYPDHLYFSPDGDALFVAGGGTSPDAWRRTGSAQSAIVISRDNGKSWSQISGGLPETLDGNIEAVTMVTWPGGFGFFAGTSDGEVFGSEDKGQSWALLARTRPVAKCIHHRNLQLGRAAVRQAAATH